MSVIRNKVKASNGILHMQLPEEFRDKIVEVVVKTESDIEKRLMTDSIKIDTTAWKFNREEIYGG